MSRSKNKHAKKKNASSQIPLLSFGVGSGAGILVLLLLSLLVSPTSRRKSDEASGGHQVTSQSFSEAKPAEEEKGALSQEASAESQNDTGEASTELSDANEEMSTASAQNDSALPPESEEEISKEESPDDTPLVAKYPELPELDEGLIELLPLEGPSKKKVLPDFIKSHQRKRNLKDRELGNRMVITLNHLYQRYLEDGERGTIFLGYVFLPSNGPLENSIFQQKYLINNGYPSKEQILSDDEAHAIYHVLLAYAPPEQTTITYRFSQWYLGIPESGMTGRKRVEDLIINLPPPQERSAFMNFKGPDKNGTFQMKFEK